MVVDLYRTPRYSPTVAQALAAAPDSAMWDDWDLVDLLTEVPKAYASRLGLPYGIFCNSGTAGLHAALMALELLPGDEVVVPCMTFIRAVTPLVHLGLIPVLADIDSQTGNLDPAAIPPVITEKTRAIVVVHMWGIPADMDAILALARKHGLYVIEDFSHAHYSQHTSGMVGSFGDVSFASLQKKKTLSVGEGGLIVTHQPDIYARLQQITSPGSFKNTANFQEFSGFGLNMRMSPFSGVVAKALLADIERIVESRAHHAKVFTELLGGFPDVFSIPAVPAYAKLVSAYGYKPSISSRTSLKQLAEGNSPTTWSFSRFSYDDILSSPFWRKSRSHYPFTLNIQPRTQPSYPGYNAYVTGRVSLAVPTVDAAFWSEEIKKTWLADLGRRLGSVMSSVAS